MFKQFCFIAAVALVFVTSLYADSVGVTYSQILDDRSLGITADYSNAISDRITFEADGTLQAGDVFAGNLNTNIVLDIAAIDFKVLINNKAKGYDIDTLGREQSLGLAFTVPIEKTNIEVGIGGKNASPFGTPNAYDTLVGEGFNESDIEGKGLGTINPKATGIPFKNGSSINAFITTGFGMGIFDVSAKAIVELIGNGEKQHQAILNFKTGGKIGDVNIKTAIEVSLMTWNDVIYREVATITSFGIDF